MNRTNRTILPALASEPFLGGFLRILSSLLRILFRFLSPRTLVS